MEVRGKITAITPATATAKGTITISAAGATTPAPAGFVWTCTLPKRVKISRFTVGDRVKARCHNVGTSHLRLNLLRKRDRGDKVRVHAIGAVEAYTPATATTPGTVKVNTGVAGQAPVECAVTSRTRVVGVPAVGGSAKVFCRNKGGVLTAVHVVERPVAAWLKGPLAVNADGSVTVAGVTCAASTGTKLPPAGTVVRAICKGTPLALVRLWRVPAHAV